MPCVTAIRALRMQKDQLQVGHTIHPSHSGRQASERPPCCHKESVAAYPLPNLAAREPVEPEYPSVVIPVMTQHYAMLLRNLLYTGVTRGKRLVVLVGQKKGRRHRGAQRLRPEALVEAGGMAQRGRREALCECIMSGVTAPPWRSRLILATSKVRDKSTESFQACTRQVRYSPNC